MAAPALRLALLGAGLSVGCIRSRGTSVAFSGCSTDTATIGYLVRTAANSIIGDEREPRIAVVRIGRTYWVRVLGGVHAFDEAWRLLTAIVDL